MSAASDSDPDPLSPTETVPDEAVHRDDPVLDVEPDRVECPVALRVVLPRPFTILLDVFLPLFHLRELDLHQRACCEEVTAQLEHLRIQRAFENELSQRLNALEGELL